MAVYSVTGNGSVYTLLAATNASSDLNCPMGASSAQTIVSSSGPLQYSTNSSISSNSLRLYPNISYALCVFSSGPTGNSGNWIAQYGWISPVGIGGVYATGYNQTQPMPAVLNATTETGGTIVIQMWVTLLVNQSSPTAPQSPSNSSAQPAGVSLGWQSASSNYTLIPSNAATELRCNNIQTYSASQLPPTGLLLQSFSATYSPAQTDVYGGVCRIALYTVDAATSQYTLVAGTNATSDLQMPQGVAAGPVAVTSNGPLYYPSGSVYYVLPNVQYSMCFYSNDQTLMGDVLMYYFVTGTSNPILTPASYSLSQPLPINPVWNGNTPNSWQLWMNVAATAPSVSSSSASATNSLSTSSSSNVVSSSAPLSTSSVLTAPTSSAGLSTASPASAAAQSSSTRSSGATPSASSSSSSSSSSAFTDTGSAAASGTAAMSSSASSVVQQSSGGSPIVISTSTASQVVGLQWPHVAVILCGAVYLQLLG